MAKRRQSVSIQEEDAFKMVIDELIEGIVWHPAHADIDVATDWLMKMVDHNVPHGNQLRGRGVISAYKSFVGTPDKETLKQIYVLGWCVELFGVAFYILDDIVRRSVTRRGKLCWHLMDEVGQGAVNDAFILKSIQEFILDKHFKSKDCHKYLVKVFHQCFFNTCLGQNMDSRISRFTMVNYQRVSKYKVGYFSFFLPMAIGKIMADGGNPDEKEMALVEDIAVDMGHLFQVQDDYLDCFGNSDVTGKYGTTIQGNQNSWFIVRALEKVDCIQEKILKENYGKPGTERVHRVIKLFRDLDLVSEYQQYEQKCYKALMEKISNLPESIPALYFSETLDLLVNREK